MTPWQRSVDRSGLDRSCVNSSMSITWSNGYFSSRWTTVSRLRSVGLISICIAWLHFFFCFCFFWQSEIAMKRNTKWHSSYTVVWKKSYIFHLISIVEIRWNPIPIFDQKLHIPIFFLNLINWIKTFMLCFFLLFCLFYKLKGTVRILSQTCKLNKK